jgi:hypothetical protein
MPTEMTDYTRESSSVDAPAHGIELR